MTSSASIRLRMLGRFAVEYRGEPVPQSTWKRRRPVDLLTTLALSPGFLLHREELIDRLWPDKELDAGANNLYRTLHDLRRVTGDDVVSVDGGVVRLQDGTWTDVHAFETAVANGDSESLSRAVDLYHGDLLPDDPYSDSLQARRQGLRQRFVDAALRLARQYRANAPDEQIDILRRVLQVDATLEDAHRMLMTVLAQTERPKEALQQFSECVKALRDHLDTEPAPETHELHQEIKNGRLGRKRSESTPIDWRHTAKRLLGTSEPRAIQGRNEALRNLERFVAADLDVLLIAGEAGAGKTRLVVECAKQCAQGGAIILAGLGQELEGAAPYTPFVDAWTDYLRVSASANRTNPFLTFQPTPGGSAQEDRLRLFQMVERSLADLAGDATVCLIIEDLHQADESSLHLFHHLARTARHLPLKLVGTLREEGVQVGNSLHILIGSLSREQLALHITLERLDREATRALVENLGENLGEKIDNKTLDTIYGLAGGNPFYTEEVANTLRDEDLATSPFPSSDLMQTVRARVTRLGQTAERLLNGASVQGLRFDFDIAQAATGLDAETALDALDSGMAARIVEEHEDRYRFRHALVREALYSSLSQARRIHLHRATAKTLEEIGGAQVFNHPEVLAFHHQAAGQVSQALPHVIAAMKRAQARLGFAEAVALCEQANELIDILGLPPGEERLEVLRAMGSMRVALSDLDNAVLNLDEAAQLHNSEDGWRPSSVQRANAKRIAGLALIMAGKLEEAEAHLDESLAELEGVDNPGEMSSVLYLFSQLRWHQNRHQEAFELAQKCLEQAEKLDDTQAIAKGYEMLALACHSLGEWRQGTEYEERRQSLADGALDVASAFDVHL